MYHENNETSVITIRLHIDELTSHDEVTRLRNSHLNGPVELPHLTGRDLQERGVRAGHSSGLE